MDTHAGCPLKTTTGVSSFLGFQLVPSFLNEVFLDQDLDASYDDELAEFCLSYSYG